MVNNMIPNDGKLNCELLKPYKGFQIEKSWLEDMRGHIMKGTIVYTAYDEEGDGLFNAAKNLNELKRMIREYVGD